MELKSESASTSSTLPSSTASAMPTASPFVFLAGATAEATASEEGVQAVGTPQVVDAQAMAETQSAQPHHAVVDLTDEAAGTPAREDVG